MHGFNRRETKLCFDVVLSQPRPSLNTMPKKGKKKSKVAEEDSDLEIMPRIEIIYEDTKSVTGADLEFKLGYIYHML